MRHIQILGFPRTGTTLMLRILHETLSEFKVESKENTIFKYFDRSENTVGKRPTDIVDFEIIQREVNRSEAQFNFILMQRDIRDVIVSMHHNVPGQFFIGWEFIYHVYGYNHYAPIGPGIKHMLNGYRRCKEDENTAIVRYENLVTNPLSIQGLLEYKLQLSFRKDFDDITTSENIDFKKTHAAHPISLSSIGNWRKEENIDRIKKQFSNFPELFDILLEDEYETDNSWYNNL